MKQYWLVKTRLSTEAELKQYLRRYPSSTVKIVTPVVGNMSSKQIVDIARRLGVTEEMIKKRR